MATCRCDRCTAIRLELARNLRWHQSGLRRIEASARDGLESLALLTARMSEVEEQLQFAISQLRDHFARGALDE